MNRILLDTSAYSHMVRGNSQVLDAVQTAEIICVNPIILGELLSGFAQGAREAQNLVCLEKFLQSPRCEIVPIMRESALRYAHIHKILRSRNAYSYK